MEMESEILETPWIIGNDDWGHYACESCARDWAKEIGLKFSNPYSTEPTPNGYAYADVYGEGESDSAWACDCGQWLSVNLTQHGLEYVRENDLPQFVKDYYLRSEED